MDRQSDLQPEFSPLTTYLALLRGINVGKAKRVPMAELRDLIAGLGFSDVRTLLNSGNAVFRGQPQAPADLAASLETVITSHFGFSVAVMVVTATELALIAAQNPLADRFVDPAQGMVGFVARPDALVPLADLAERDWGPEALAFGPLALYLWCANGVIESKAAKALDKTAGKAVTLRNWATVQKLLALVGVESSSKPKAG
ncbi:MAG: DUF1697 domain-containing protein [Spirochaetales bacterium]